ncbi:TonB-dependent receptor domain-containing protein [Rhizorhabdus histidinilytica]
MKNLSTGADQYGFENYGFAAKLDLDLSDTVTAKLSADYRHGYSTFGQALNIVPSTGIGAQQIAALGFTPTPGVVKMATDGISFDRSRGYSFTGELGWEANDRVKVTSITGYRDFRDDNLSDVDNTPAGFLIGKGFSPNPTRYPVMYVSTDTPRQPQRVSYFSEELRANYSDERLDVVGGFFYQTLKDRGEGVTPFIFDGAFVLRNPALAGTYFYNATYLNYRIDDDTWAAFGDVTFKLNDTLSLFAGARYTHESIQLKYDNVSYFGAVAANYGAVILPGPNGQPAIDVATARPNLAPTGAINYQIGRVTNNVSGRAGIQWQPTTDYNFYFSYNRGYKGSAADVSRGSGNPTATYSPLLAPEIATSFELGSKGRLFDGNVQYSLNFFKQKVRNLQQAVVQLTGANATVTQLINAGAVKTDGVEFEARARCRWPHPRRRFRLCRSTLFGRTVRGLLSRTDGGAGLRQQPPGDERQADRQLLQVALQSRRDLYERPAEPAGRRDDQHRLAVVRRLAPARRHRSAPGRTVAGNARCIDHHRRR